MDPANSSNTPNNQSPVTQPLAHPSDDMTHANEELYKKKLRTCSIQQNALDSSES